MGLIEDLASASQKGNKNLVEGLINNISADVNEQDTHGCTPLFWAAREGKADIVKLLINAGADLNQSNNDKDTPLTISSSEGYIGIVISLIQSGVLIDKGNKNGWTALICASYHGHVQVANRLLDAHADINLTSNVGCSALYWACNNQQTEVVQLLLQHNANVNITNNDGKTPLMISCRSNCLDIIEMLLQQHDIDVNIADNDQRTVLFHMVDANNINLTTLLLNHGADSRVVDAEDKSLMYIATSGEVVQLLQKHNMQRDIRANMKRLEVAQPVVSYASVMEVVVDNSAKSSVVSNAYHTFGSIEASDKSLTYSMTEEEEYTPTTSEHRVSNADVVLINTRLLSLAQASPQVIAYLRGMGDRAVEAEQQYSRIVGDPVLHEYYLTFIKSISSAVLACQALNSNMIADDRVSNSEFAANTLNDLASASGLCGVPLVTSVLTYLVRIPNDIERKYTMRRLTNCFPSIDSHKYVEILAREVTILLAADIKTVLRLAKKHSKASIYTMVYKAVEWLATYENVTPIQSYATMHAALLLDKLMHHEPSFTVQITDIPLLIQWATGIDTTADKERGSGDFDHLPPPASTVPPEIYNAPPVVTYAEQEVVDERINTLMLRLTAEEAARTRIETQLNEVRLLSDKMKKLDALNEIFGSLQGEDGGLASAVSKESITRSMESHFARTQIAQGATDETVRELILQVQLMMEAAAAESSGSNSPTRSAKREPEPVVVINNRIEVDTDTPSPSKKKFAEEVQTKGCCVIS